MRIRLLGVGVKMGIVDRGHAQSDDVIRCPETFADHEYSSLRACAVILLAVEFLYQLHLGALFLSIYHQASSLQKPHTVFTVAPRYPRELDIAR